MASRSASAASGNLLEVQILGPHPRLLSQSLWGRDTGICVSTSASGDLMHVKDFEPLSTIELTWQRIHSQPKTTKAQTAMQSSFGRSPLSYGETYGLSSGLYSVFWF